MKDKDIKQYSIIGKGITGQSFLSFYQNQGKSTQVLELNQYSPAIIPLLQGTTVAITPGLKPFWKEVFDKNQIDFISDLDIFLEQTTCGNIILITGTNGKTSTVEILSHCLKQLVKPHCQVFVAGNIGLPLLCVLGKERYDDYVLIEVSSYQLFWSQYQANKAIKHSLGLITSFDQDHLDWHESFENYREAKAKIFNLSKTVLCDRSCHTLFPKALKATKIEGEVSCQPLINLNKDIILEALLYLGFDIRNKLQHYIQNWQASPARSARHNIGAQYLINDAKATNLSAVLSLLTTIKKDEKILWFLGGDLKGQALESLKVFEGYPQISFAIFGADCHLLELLPLNVVFKDSCFKKLLKGLTNIDNFQGFILSPAGTSRPYFSSYECLGQHWVESMQNKLSLKVKT